jgi:hypothetical protein
MNSRIHGRVAVDRAIQCHINDAQEWVFLYDLSAGGAMIEVAKIKIEVGDPVRLNLYDVITINGRIAWKSEKNAGVCFDLPLGNAIVERLGFGSTALGFDEFVPRDRFGQLIPNVLQGKAPLPGEEQSRFDRRPGDWLEKAQQQEDRRKQDRDAAQRRREDRLEFDAKTTLCVSMLDGIEGRLADLSANGCSFLVHSDTFKPRNEVWLKIEPLEPWKGTVRWVGEDRVGIEFERPFYPAIFDHLVKSSLAAVCSKAA